MPAAIDQSTDITSQMRHVIQKIHTVPEFVKTASDNDQFGDPEVLQNHVYADPSKRRFPCHTKAATWLSAAYFAHQQSQYSKTQGDFVRDRILKTAQFFNIEPGVRELFKEAAAVNSYEDAATPDTAYALIWKDAAGDTQKSYPMRNPSEVKIAADWFNKNWTDFDFDTRHEIARKLFTKLAELQVAVDDSDQIERCAGFGYCEKEAMQKAWETRAILSRKKYPEYSKQASVLAQSIADNTVDLRDFSLRTKMASSMDDFDSVTMLRKFYGGSIDWPENTLFSVTQKVASEFISDHVMTTSGAVYEHSELQQLTAGDLRDWMGNDFMAKCGGVIINHRKLAEVLPTLTREDAQLFDKLATVKGISTVGRTHGEPSGISDDELHEFASAYSVSR